MHSKTLTSLFLLLVIAAVFSACKKHDGAGNDAKPSKPLKPSYTAKMGGVRNWHGYHEYHASGIHYDPPVNEYYAFPDASFALAIVDDKTINYNGSIYPFEKSDSAGKVLFFGSASNFPIGGVGTGIIYYYEKDSIVHCRGEAHGTNDFTRLTELYYTY